MWYKNQRVDVSLAEIWFVKDFFCLRSYFNEEIGKDRQATPVRKPVNNNPDVLASNPAGVYNQLIQDTRNQLPGMQVGVELFFKIVHFGD